MPITQDRVITLINEALALRRVHLALREEIMTALAAHRADSQQAVALIESALLWHQTPHCENIIAESVHFHQRRKENERNRNRMRRHRETPAGTPRNAPLSLIRPITDSDLDGLDLLEAYEKWNKGELP
jgi:hypothetical protein